MAIYGAFNRLSHRTRLQHGILLHFTDTLFMLTAMDRIIDNTSVAHSTAPAHTPVSRTAAYCRLLSLLLLYVAGTAAAIEPAQLMRGFDQGQVTIETAANGRTAIDVYIASNHEQRAQGLMQVSAMNRHEGMVFVYPDKSVISMWMKNTLIPLDMVFADKQGRIMHMHRNAVPHDTSIISSVEAVALVLELNAGSIDAFGIAIGDRITFSSP